MINLIFLTLLFSGQLMAESISEMANKIAKERTKVLEEFSSPKYLEKTIPGYTEIDQQELEELKSMKDLTGLSTEEAEKNDVAILVNKGYEERPEIEIDKETDPIFNYDDERRNMAHIITKTYQDCQEIPYNGEDKSLLKRDFCFENKGREIETFNCVNKAMGVCRNDNISQIRYFSPDDFKDPSGYFNTTKRGREVIFGRPLLSRGNHGCRWYSNTVNFKIDDVFNIRNLILRNVIWDDWIRFYVNGKLVFSKGNGNCELGTVFRESPNINLIPFLKQGGNTITVKNMVGNGGGVRFTLYGSRSIGCNKKYIWSRKCDGKNNLKKSEKMNSKCIDNQRNKKIGKFTFSLPCWEYKELWGKSPFRKEEKCYHLERDGCYIDQKKCLTENCLKKKLDYFCPSLNKKTVAFCGDDLICPDGKCSKKYAKKTQNNPNDFKKAATALGVASALSKEVSKGEIRIFDGKAKICLKKERIKGVGIKTKQCCPDKNGGILIDLGLGRCGPDEIMLAEDVKAKRTMIVGEYKIKKKLSRKYYRSYCVYPSKLARIIITQGARQLGKGFGSVKSPNCEGLTPNELSRLNFDKIDFKELYQEFYEKTKRDLPDVNKETEKVKENLKRKWKKR